MRETESLRVGRSMYSNAFFLNRFSKNGVYFDSPAYSRAPSSGLCNSFVRYLKDDTECFGYVLYSVSIPDAPFFGKVCASVLEYRLLEEIGPVKGFFYTIRKTEQDELIEADSILKVFAVAISEFDCCVMKLCKCFEHS